MINLKHYKPIFFGVLCAVVCLAVVLSTADIYDISTVGAKEKANSSVSSKTTASKNTKTASKKAKTASKTASVKTVSKKTKTAKNAYQPPENYDFASPVPKTEAKPLSYFDDAAFMGDSRTVDLMIYSKITKTKARAYCDIGLNVGTVLTKNFVNYDGVRTTPLAALRLDKKVKKVYIMFGINELGYDRKTFIDMYMTLVRNVRETRPDVEIYVQSVLPVTKSKDKSDKTFNNVTVHKFNAAIKAMCEKLRLYYIDAYDAMTDPEGYLPEEAAYDGIHFTSAYCDGWLNFLLQHTV